MQNKTAIIGGAAGAGFGALLGRYTIYPLWRNRQVDIAAATDPAKAALYTTVSALVGGVAGYFIANRVRRDAAETKQRTRRVRDRSNVYYHNALQDSRAAGVLTVIGVDMDGTPTLVFPGEIDSLSAETMAAWDAVSGHGGINEDLVKQLVRQRKRLSVAKELELIAKYDRQYGTGLQRATRISWPKWYRLRYDQVRTIRKESGRMNDDSASIHIGMILKSLEHSVAEGNTKITDAARSLIRDWNARRPYDKQKSKLILSYYSKIRDETRPYWAIEHRTDNGDWEVEDGWYFNTSWEAEHAIRNHTRESGLSRDLYRVVKVKV
jgi:hypothetical protein